MLKKPIVYLQYLVPQHALTAFAGKIANSQIGFIKNTVINLFMRRYKVNLNEACINNPHEFKSFNDFFTRALRRELRPIVEDANAIVSPVDGKISQLGNLEGETLIQAKGHYYSLVKLLADDNEWYYHFNNGAFATFYLGPPDYHRVHMPIAGKLVKTIFVPGQLFSVNQNTAAQVPNLYTRNERLICFFETEIGKMAVIMIGALIVGGIKPAWENKAIRAKKIEIKSHNLAFNKGDELGLFQLGSSVIILFQKQKVKWQASSTLNLPLRFGQLIGNIES